MTNIIYDVIYSIIAHESFDSLIQLINNIKLCNKEINFLIILHLNTSMYENYLENKYNDDKVLVNNIYYDKKINNIDLTKSHIDNFEYLINNNIIFLNFCFLASNCYFIKPINKFNVFGLLNNPKKNTTNFYGLNNWYWGKYLIKNKKIIELLNNNSIEILIGQIEGRTINYDVMLKIIDFINKNNFYELIECQFCFEEFIFPTLENYFAGRYDNNICKVFWNNKNYYPSIKDIDDVLSEVDENIYCVKRVLRNDKCVIKTYIDNLLKKKHCII